VEKFTTWRKREKYNGDNSHFNIKSESVIHVWDTKGCHKRFHYNKSKSKLIVFGNYDSIFIHYWGE